MPPSLPLSHQQSSSWHIERSITLTANLSQQIKAKQYKCRRCHLKVTKTSTNCYNSLLTILVDICRCEMSLAQRQQGRTTTVPVWITLYLTWTSTQSQELFRIVFELGMSIRGIRKECWVKFRIIQKTLTPHPPHFPWEYQYNLVSLTMDWESAAVINYCTWFHQIILCFIKNIFF